MALWLIGIMAEMGLDLAERHNSERLRCFCDGQTDGQTDRQTDGRTDGHLRF